MSAISQKSISGITSITTPAGVDNVFTVHTNDTTERFRVDSTGSLNIAGISTFNDRLHISSTAPVLKFTETDNSKDFFIVGDSNKLSIRKNTTAGGNVVQEWMDNSVLFRENVQISKQNAVIELSDPDSSDANYQIRNDNGTFDIKDSTNSTVKIRAASSYVTIYPNLNANNGLDVMGTITGDGNLDIADSIRHVGDTDTKITFTDNQIDLHAAGSSRAYINNYGLYIASGFPLAFLASSGATPNIKSGGTNAQDLLFTTGSGNPTRLQIDSSGRVGINSSSLNHLFEVHALGNDSNNFQQIAFERKTSANSKQAFGLVIRSNAQSSSGNEPTAYLRFDARASSLNGSHGGNAIIAFSPIGVTQGTYGKGNLDFYLRSGGPYTFLNDPGGAGEMQPKLRIDSEGRVMMGGATSAHGSTNRDDLVIGAVNQANQTGITIGSASASGISFADAGNDTAGGIYYSHGNDDMIFYAGGNQRGKVYNDAGITGIEHHRFIPFLIGYDAQSTSDITMSKGFGGMSRLPINADGDKAFMSYVTHWRHREYAGVYFWYGASGNTSGATFDWDFTVWNAGSGGGYSSSSHTFTITSGTMSNGKMYRLNATSSWPTHAATKFVQFVIEYDELQNGTSLQLSGMELAEYTTP